MEQDYEIIRVDEYLKTLWRQKLTIAAIFFLGLGVAVLATLVIPDTYQARAVLETEFEGTNRNRLASQLRSQYPSLDVDIASDPTLLILKLNSRDPQDASERLESLASQIVVEQKEAKSERLASLMREKEFAETAISKLQGTTDLQVILLAMQLERLKEIEEDIRDSSKVSLRGEIQAEKVLPNPGFNILVGTSLGLFLGVVAAFAKEWISKEHKS